MSNNEASKLYETIIEDVINDSRQDFEDSGIDESTLQDLRRIWCEKLSQSSVAKFSWDEEDQDVADSSLNQQELPSSSASNGNNGLELPTSQNGDVLSYNTVTSNSIGIEIPEITKKDESDDTGLMLPKINQADGTFEFTFTTENGAQFMNALQKKNEKRKRKKLVQADGAYGEDDDDDDDIFNDSDDINSDLDDDLESEKSDDEDDQVGQIMLCLYDKVQRIKNKWKSNLKEGIANIDGKDYVFHKATGESEW
ncbi:transcription initiation factor TFIIA large subunit [Scheffersomyces xylosifermentans]|uniref:transcription initiation factor TFIIA large subunit n=1 Tax=Scheffersomyces xylosifermentans TaxID=1304137 RepID=UPI00315DAEBD